jgi:hypothetical protein
MPVILKTPGAPLFAKKANGSYYLYQGFAGLGATHVMAAPVRHSGFPGIWTAQEIGPDGHYGPERFIHRDLAKPIGGGEVHKFNRYLTLPIDKAFAGFEGEASLPWLVRVAIGFAGAALLAAVVRKEMVSNTPLVRQQVEDDLWLIYWRQPGTDLEDATLLGTIIDYGKGEGQYQFRAEATSGATGTHESLEDAESWLVKKTWRVVPGGKR